MDFFIIVSFLQRVLKLGGGWSPILHCESLPHSFEIAKTIPEFFAGFIDKGLVLNAPHNFQIIPLEYGHGGHIELLFFYDRFLPDAKMILPELMKQSAETDLRHGHYSPSAYREKLYSNFQVWATKIKNAF